MKANKKKYPLYLYIGYAPDQVTMCKEGKPEFEFSAAEDMSAISSQKRLLILGKEWIPWQQYTKVYSKT